MSYLLDKKTKQKKYLKLGFAALTLIILIYFQSGIFRGLSVAAHTIFRPVLFLGNGTGNKFSSLGAYFSSKSSLSRENEELKSQLDSASARMADYNILLGENLSLKEILARKSASHPMILGSILSKPNHSPYDTLIVDIGSDHNVVVGKMVFAFGNIPIGRVAEVYGNSAKIVLFSSPGEKTEAVMGINNIFIETVGRGGGNFEVSLPRDLLVEKGMAVTLPGISSYVLATVEAVISQPNESFQKVVLVSPVNIQQLKFVEVEI